jgi:hypothetical protein
MKPGARFSFCALMLLLLSSPGLAQVSFFQPPTYAGTGPIFVADFNGDGKPDILCSDGTLNLGNGNGTFTAGTKVSGTPLAVADFNGDGHPDILEQGTGTLLVLLGNGDGTFHPPISTASGATLSPVVAADLNGDGKADVIGVFVNTLYVYISNGDGTFASGVPYSLGTSSIESTVLTLGDFNGDKITDIAVSTNIVSGGNVLPGQELVFLGNGDGTFQAAIASTGIDYPTSAVAGDFNGDGKLDLMIFGSTDALFSSTAVFLLLGNGNGTFQAPTPALPGFVGSVVVPAMVAADVSNDGKLDLIFNAGATQIFLGNGDGTFSNANNYIGSYIGGGSMAVADFNLDGNLDIAADGSVLLGNGNGTFQGIQTGLLPPTTQSAEPTVSVAGDFENNGKVDVAAVSVLNALSIFRNNGSGQLSLIGTYTLPQNAGQVGQMVAGDFNGDGNLDLLMTAGNAASEWGYILLLGNGNGSFQTPAYYSEGSGDPRAISVADFNGDKKLDLAVAVYNPAAGNEFVAILLGNGDGTFAAPVSYFGGNSVLVADYNGDGKLDIASGANSIGTAILYGNGDGTFQAAVFPASLNDFGAATFTADLNNDGKPDLMSVFQVALGNGDGTFTVLPVLAGGVSFGEFADFNGDGKLDALAYTNNDEGNLQETGVILGNGDGTFGPMIAISTTGLIDSGGAFPSSVPVVDMNADGKPDIVFAWADNGLASGLGVLLNTTPAGFDLSASALSPGTVMPGNPATSTVQISPTFGFNGTVTLACSALPTGASCTFNPASITNASGTSSLSVSTSASTAAGTYPIQVQGVSGSVVNNATLSLIVQAPPDFALGSASGSPTSQTIAAGKTAMFSLDVTPSGSFTGTVNLSCAITPVATLAPTCSLSSSTVQISGTGSQSFTLTVGTTAPVTTAMVPQPGFLPPPGPLTCIFILLGTILLGVRRRKLMPAVAASALAFVLMFGVSCGGNNSSPPHTTPGTPAGTYTATVTATSGSLSHNAALQVVVQ